MSATISGSASVSSSRWELHQLYFFVLMLWGHQLTLCTLGRAADSVHVQLSMASSAER